MYLFIESVSFEYFKCLIRVIYLSQIFYQYVSFVFS